MNDVNNLVDKLKGDVAYRQFDNAPSPNRHAWPVLERIAEAQGRALGTAGRALGTAPPVPAPSAVPQPAIPTGRYGHAQEAPAAMPPNSASNFPMSSAPGAPPSAPPVAGLPFAMGAPAPMPSHVPSQSPLQPPNQPAPGQPAPGMSPMGVFASPQPQSAPLPHGGPSGSAYAAPAGHAPFQPAPAVAPAPPPTQTGSVPLSQLLGGAPLRAAPPPSPTGSLLSRYGGHAPAAEPTQQLSGQFATDPSTVALSDVFARLGRQTR